MASKRLRGWLTAVIAIGALGLAVTSDFWLAPFWQGHPMVTAILSALVVVLVSASVIEVVLRRRSERRWGVLAQAALIELAEAAHASWSAIVEGLGRKDATGDALNAMTAELSSGEHAAEVREHVESVLVDAAQRDELLRAIGDSLEASRQLVTTWAVVMTGSETYAEIFDEHAEMVARMNGLQYFLVNGYRISDPRRLRGRVRREFRSPGGEEEDAWFVNNLLTTLNIALALENRTWDLALRVVPTEWWDRRTVELAARSRRARGPSTPWPR